MIEASQSAGNADRLPSTNFTRLSGKALAPGAIIIRPTRDDAEKLPEEFYTLIESLRRADVLPYGKIADAIGDKSPSYQSNISHKMKARSFTPAQRQQIIRAIFADQMTASGGARSRIKKTPDPFYFSLLEFMNVRETSQDNARAEAIGTYSFWRHSIDHEGEYVLGRVDIYEDPVTHALRVEMNQQKKRQNGVLGAHERFEGYFFRFANSYLLILHDPENEDLRMTHFTSSKIDTVGVGCPGKSNSVFAGCRKHLIYLRGFVSGTDGKEGFYSPVEMVLVEDVEELKTLDDRLDVIPSGDPRLPPRVEAYLNRQGKMRRF